MLPVTVRARGPTLIDVGLMAVRTGVGLSSVRSLEPMAEESTELVA